MMIVNRQPKATADISSARGSACNELCKLVLSAVLLQVSLYFILGWTVDFVVARISFEMEARIFSDDQPPAAANDEDEHEAYLTRAELILSKLTQSDTAPPLPYRIVVLDKEAPNAFAFPGGTIGVTTGLLDVLSEEIEVAFVLGHELGHFRNRDHLQGMGRAIGFSVILYTIFGSSPGADSLGSMIDFVLQRDYSQKRESCRLTILACHWSMPPMERWMVSIDSSKFYWRREPCQDGLTCFPPIRHRRSVLKI